MRFLQTVATLPTIVVAVGKNYDDGITVTITEHLRSRTAQYGTVNSAHDEQQVSNNNFQHNTSFNSFEALAAFPNDKTRSAILSPLRKLILPVRVPAVSFTNTFLA